MTSQTPSRYDAAALEVDVLIEAGHPSRPDREELMRQHIRRIKARAWDEGSRATYLFERGETYPEPKNPYRDIPSGNGGAS